MVVYPCKGKEQTRCIKRFKTWRTLGISGGTLSNTLKNFTLCGFPNIMAEVKMNLMTEVNTKEDTVIATTTEKVVFFSSSSGSIEMYQSTRKNREVPKMVGVSRQNMVGVNPLEITPVQEVTMSYEYLKIRREGGTLHGRHLCSYY